MTERFSNKFKELSNEVAFEEDQLCHPNKLKRKTTATRKATTSEPKQKQNKKPTTITTYDVFKRGIKN